MWRILAAIVVSLAVLGCGDNSEGAVTIRLEDVPEPAMKTARAKLPDVPFNEARRKKDGTYEVRGKDKSGKVREVEVKADGTFVDIE